MHHDACGPGSERNDSSAGSVCAQLKLGGAPNAVATLAPLVEAGSWAASGGLSAAITQTFFGAALGCTCEPQRQGA